MASMPRLQDRRSHRSPDLWLVVSVLRVVFAGCGVPARSLLTIGPGIEVPAEELRPVDRCMFDAGFRATEVHAGRAGSNSDYSWDVPTWYVWEAAGDGATPAAMVDCRNRFAQYKEKTVEEVREIYDRWVLERECLIGLGFQPASPPPFETFQGSWKTGPLDADRRGAIRSPWERGAGGMRAGDARLIRPRWPADEAARARPTGSRRHVRCSVECVHDLIDWPIRGRPDVAHLREAL